MTSAHSRMTRYTKPLRGLLETVLILQASAPKVHLRWCLLPMR